MTGHDVTDSPAERDRFVSLPGELDDRDSAAVPPRVPLSRRRFLVVLGLLPFGFGRPVQEAPYGGVSRKRAMFSRKITQCA